MQNKINPVLWCIIAILAILNALMFFENAPKLLEKIERAKHLRQEIKNKR